MIDPRYLGHIPDSVDGTENLYARHPELASAPPPQRGDPDLRADLPEIRLQIAPNCCAHATSDAAGQVAAATGQPLPFAPDFASVLHLYAIAQLRARPRQPLANAGSSLKHMFDGVRYQGLIGECDWPEVPENVEVVPPDHLWRRGEGTTIVASHMIADGASSTGELLAALHRRRTPTICMMVDERFANIGDEVYSMTGGRVSGSHCMLVTGHSEVLHAFRVRNSWGKDFGDEGYVWIDEGFVDRMTYGKWVFDLGPTVRRAPESGPLR